MRATGDDSTTEGELRAALERERAARAEVEAFQERLAFVYSATGQLYSTPLDVPLRVQTLARLVVPSLADWCLVHARPRAGGGRWRAAAHWDPDRLEGSEALIGREAWPAWAVGAGQHGDAELVADVAAAERVSDPRLVTALGLRSFLVVPLRAGRGPFGAVLFGFAESNRQYTARDLELLQDLAQRAAIALENAELFHEAEVALRARDQLVSIASHDVRNPIGAAALRVAVLRAALDRGGLPPAKLAEGLAGVERGLQQAVALLNDLLNVTRIASNRLELKLEQVDLVELAREVAERSRELLQAAGCDLVAPPVGAPASGPVTGWWDRMRLEQVLANLLSNAVKYGRGRPVAVRVEAAEGKALLSVTDQGVGIPPEEHERIFDRFGQGSGDRRDDSHGLGLWIVKRVVAAHGGRVWVASRAGAGATFHVELPLGPERGVEGRRASVDLDG